MSRLQLSLALSLVIIASVAQAEAPAQPLAYPEETHLANLRQLSFGGQNAEAYFSFDGSELIFQSTRDELECDAIFRMASDGSRVRQVSSGEGATTGGQFNVCWPSGSPSQMSERRSMAARSVGLNCTAISA